MSSPGCYIIVKDQKISMVYERMLATSQSFIIDIVFGLKNLERSVSIVQEMIKDDNFYDQINNLDELIHNDYVELDGAILINYDAKSIYFYEGGVLSKELILFIEESSTFPELFSGWKINYEPEGYKKIAEKIGQKIDCKDTEYLEDSEDSEEFPRLPFSYITEYFIDLVCKNSEKESGKLLKLLSEKRLTLFAKILSKLGLVQPAQNRKLLEKVIFKNEHKEVVQRYIKSNKAYYEQNSGSSDGYIALHNRLLQKASLS